MKIAISAEQPNVESPVDLRFGRAKFFMIHDDENQTWEFIDNEHDLNSAQGAGIQSAANVVSAGCKVLISGHCGPKAFTALSKAGVSVFTVKGGTVLGAVAAYKDGKLKKLVSADVEGHW